jgi:hypothetical protein
MLPFPPESAPDKAAAARPPWLHEADVPAPDEAPGLDFTDPGAVVRAAAELVLVFATTTEVLNAEDRLEDEDLDFALIPVPKEVNPNCGLAISFSEKIAPDIDRVLAGAGLSPLAVYRRMDESFILMPGSTD